jgi:uncharacterized zinc-type alcohol dehydrogenase-like protein
MKTQAWVCPSQGSRLELQEIELPPLKPHEVQIEITHCGLCHTDIHMRDNDWGVSNYPLVAGHEGLGQVVAVGEQVSTSRVGDTVGVGWLRDSCGGCRHCRSGRDNLCEAGYQGTYLSSNAGIWGKEAHNEHGCFTRCMNVAERFAFKIPDGMAPETAAPLLCAGITVWEPIADYVRPNSRVGVVSLGGLGHMAVQFALAVGAEVWALSSSTGKEKRIKELGAHHFVHSTNPDALNAIASTLDVIIDTCPVPQDISPYMGTLALGGTYCKVGIPPASFSYDFIPLIFTQKKIAGSIVSGSLRTNDMLALAAYHGIHCDVEVMSFEKINEAMERLLKGENQNFRIVLKW